jgi:hypothetical protein
VHRRCGDPHRLSAIELLAHGVSSQEDLPVPFSYALSGAGLAVVVSFVAAAALWGRPRLGNPHAGLRLPAWVTRVADAAAVRGALRALGLALLAYAAVPALAAPHNDFNPTPDVVYVLFWVGVLVTSLLFGPVWRLLNPLRTLAGFVAALIGVDPDSGVRPLPKQVGYWPAVAGIAGFVWLELVAPFGRNITVLLTAAAVYALVHVSAGVVFGQRWFNQADAFEAYSTLLGHLSVIGRTADGRLALRNPLQGLPRLPAGPGLVALLCLLLGATAFDALTATAAWENHGPTGHDPASIALASLALAGITATVHALYRIACRATVDHPSSGEVASRLAHSLVPIIAGYAIAHYFTLLIYSGQQALVLLSDPLQTGADVLGLTGHALYTDVAGRTAIAVVQIAAIVTGHVLGVLAAHDAALVVLPRQRLVRGQIPMLALMVVYTVGGIALLFNA